MDTGWTSSGNERLSLRAACIGAAILLTCHEPLALFQPPSHVILSNAKDLLLRCQKQILHVVYPRAHCDLHGYGEGFRITF